MGKNHLLWLIVWLDGWLDGWLVCWFPVSYLIISCYLPVTMTISCVYLMAEHHGIIKLYNVHLMPTFNRWLHNCFSNSSVSQFIIHITQYILSTLALRDTWYSGLSGICQWIFHGLDRLLLQLLLLHALTWGSVHIAGSFIEKSFILTDISLHTLAFCTIFAPSCLGGE